MPSSHRPPLAVSRGNIGFASRRPASRAARTGGTATMSPSEATPPVSVQPAPRARRRAVERSKRARPSMLSGRKRAGRRVTHVTWTLPSRARSAAIWAPEFPPADHDDVLAGEVGRGAVVHRVELPAGEDAAAGGGGEEGLCPGAGGADDRPGSPGARVCLDQELRAVAAHGARAGAVQDRQVVALLVIGEVVHHVPGFRVSHARPAGHEPAGQRGIGGRREQVQRVPHVLQDPPGVASASRMTKSRPRRRRW